MHRRTFPAPLVVVLTFAAATGTPAFATDVRSLGPSGSIVADGRGANGAHANPAALMAMRRRGERVHLGIGFGVAARDDAELIDIVSDAANDSLQDDIERAIDRLDIGNLRCDPRASGGRDEVCVTGLDALADLSSRASGILDRIDGETTRVQAASYLGVAVTAPVWPFAIHVSCRVTGRGAFAATERDRAYFDGFATALGGADPVRGQLTRGEIVDTAALTFDAANGTLDVERPGDVLESDVEFGTLVRVTVGASLATTLDIAGRAVDVGVTPKLSSIAAYGIDTSLADEFDAVLPAEDRLDASEIEDSSFTFDVGGATLLPGVPIRIAAVVRDVVPESVETRDGFVFETSPQLIVGGLLRRGPAVFHVDLALNEASRDSVETQVLAIGSELAAGAFALRAGIDHDLARVEAATALSLGLGLGPLQLGVRLSAPEQLQAGVQIRASF